MSPFLSPLLVPTVICQTCLHHDTSDFHNYCIVLFLTHHTSWHLHKPKSYRIKCCCCCWPPFPLPRCSWPVLGRACPGWAVRPPDWMLLSTVTISLCPHHHHLSSDEGGRGAAGHGEQRNIAHIIHFLYRRDMKIMNNYRATATALQQQNQECFPTTNTHMHI